MSGAIPPTTWPATKRAICLEYPDTVEWTALVSGVIQLLSFGYYWNKDYANWEDAKNAGQEIYQSWIEQIRCDAGAVPIDEPQCVDYPNNSPLLDWEPANPFTGPGDIPPGYVAQPWGVVPDPPVFPYQTGDVISGLFGLPVLTPAINEGLARVRVKFNGRGTVEVHIIKVALGGIALFTWDDNPFTARFVDTSMDFLAIPPESGDEDIQEITFDTDGDHHIDVTMLPKFTTEVGFAGYGGGIRKVVLCGPDLKRTDVPGETFTVSDFFDSPENGGKPMALCESIRWNNGSLQAWCCGEWQDVPGQPSQGIGGPGQPGAGSPQPEPGGGQQCYTGNLSALSRWLLPAPVSAGDVLSVTNAKGAGNDGSEVPWRCPNGDTYFAGTCYGPGTFNGGDPLTTSKHMALIWLIDGTYYDALAGDVTVPGGVSSVNAELMVNDSVLNDNYGSYTFDVCVTNNGAINWQHCWLGGKGAVGLTLPPQTQIWGSYDLSNDRIASEDSGAGTAEYASVDVPYVGTVTHIEFDVVYDNDGPSGSAGTGIATDANNPGTQNLYAVLTPVGTGTLHVSWSGSQAIASRVRLFASSIKTVVGSTKITSIKVQGDGGSPFGADNC